MPEICRFYGIVIKMFFDVLIDIRHVAVFAGGLSARALGLVVEWAWLHRGELLTLWEKAKSCEPLHRIDPLT